MQNKNPKKTNQVQAIVLRKSPETPSRVEQAHTGVVQRSHQWRLSDETHLHSPPNAVRPVAVCTAANTRMQGPMVTHSNQCRHVHIQSQRENQGVCLCAWFVVLLRKVGWERAIVCVLVSVPNNSILYDSTQFTPIATILKSEGMRVSE
jgi:hypothetical protein